MMKRFFGTERAMVFWEIVLIFGVLYAHGAWAVPDVNEANYLGKAIHFWNPAWGQGDAFLESKDAHWFFYATFGWVSLFLSPTAFAWTGRFLAWGLLAWSWRRLSFTLVPVRFLAPWTALTFLAYLDSFQMAGEWVVGGVEGKGFAYPLLMLGLDSMIRGRWRRVWIYFGIASAFHVLVGGWAVLIAMGVWSVESLTVLLKSRIIQKRFNESNERLFPETQNELSRPTPLLRMIPFLILGGLCSLPGLLPALSLDAGVPKEIADKAHWIYVFQRLPHHLLPDGFPWTYKLRFVVLVILWGVVWYIVSIQEKEKEKEKRRQSNSDGPQMLFPFNRLNLFVLGSLLLAGIGMIIAQVCRSNEQSAANLFRFYWFRTSDFAVPLSFSLMVASLFVDYVRQLKKSLLFDFRAESSKNGGLTAFLVSIIVLCGIGFMLFLLLDGLIFGVFAITWNPPPEPAIPWGMTMIFGIMLLAFTGSCFDRFYRMVSRIVSTETVSTTGTFSADSVSAESFRGERLFRTGVWTLLFAILLFWGPLEHLIGSAEQRTRFAYSRGDMVLYRAAKSWTEMCHWISDPKNGIPQDARFLTPKDMITFKWITARPEVATWKEIPQDAPGIIKWYDTVEELYTYSPKDGPVRRDFPLEMLLHRTDPEKFAIRLRRLKSKYEFDFLLCGKSRMLPLPVLYENTYYILYDTRNVEQQTTSPAPATSAY